MMLIMMDMEIMSAVGGDDREGDYLDKTAVLIRDMFHLDSVLWLSEYLSRGKKQEKNFITRCSDKAQT